MNFLYAGARTLFSLPIPMLSPVVIDGLTLHPELQLMITLRERLGRRPLTELTPRQARKRLRQEVLTYEGPRLPVDAVRDFHIGEIRVRHYRPFPSRGRAPSPARRPLLVYLHGGGFVLGDLDTSDIICRHLCRFADLHVLSVDYRLAPEHPFPAPLDDALAVFRWARENARALGADRVAIGGDSAGGHLSAVVTQDLLRLGEPQPAAQLLLYPATCRRRVRPSLLRFEKGFMLERSEIEWFHFHYSGFLGPDDDIRLRPLDGLATLDAALAPALVVTAGFDPLRDEGEEYADKLRDLGSHVHLKRLDSLVHGFANIACVSPGCERALVDVAKQFQQVLS